MLTEYDDYVRERNRGAFQGTGKAVATGIACPSCGLNEIQANLEEVLDYDPPQHPAWCKACGWNGTV